MPDRFTPRAHKVKRKKTKLYFKAPAYSLAPAAIAVRGCSRSGAAAARPCAAVEFPRGARGAPKKGTATGRTAKVARERGAAHHEIRCSRRRTGWRDAGHIIPESQSGGRVARPTLSEALRPEWDGCLGRCETEHPLQIGLDAHPAGAARSVSVGRAPESCRSA